MSTKPNPDTLMSTALADLKHSLELAESNSSDNDGRIRSFETAMTAILALHALADSDQEPSPQQLEEFRSRFVELATPNILTVFNYVDGTFYYATDPVGFGWETAGLRRSALQILIDEYPGGREALGADNIEQIDEIDDLFHEHADDIEPLPDTAIPKDLPASHWWWHLPRATPEEAESARRAYDR
ncbi:hypothetical protein [Nocardia arizonensis]|uniref:hypothetical protein n=1 Tax=Nocardia arizonensis TaxID=1141647 RepID=UPI0006D0BB32|nr:hypothetical protein [Nocardia arizonensis]